MKGKLILLVIGTVLSLIVCLFCMAGAITDNFSTSMYDKAVDHSPVNTLWTLGAVLTFFLGGGLLHKLKTL